MPARIPLFAFTLAALLGSATLASAQPYTWDADTGTFGPQDGTGTWSTSNANWWNGTTSADVVWNNAGNWTAIFGANSGAAGNVTVNGEVVVGGITFNSPSSGTYTLFNGTGGLITLAGGATIANNTGGVRVIYAGLNLLGTVNLTGASIYLGGTSYGGGTLNVGSTSALTLNGSNALSGVSTLNLNAGGLNLAGGSYYAPTTTNVTQSLSVTGTSSSASYWGGGFTVAGTKTLTLSTATSFISGYLAVAGVIGESGGVGSVAITTSGSPAPPVVLANVANTYTGATTMLGTSTLVVTTVADGGTASSLGKSSNAAANLTLAAGGTLRYVGDGTNTTNRLFTITRGSDTTIEANGTGALKFTNTGADVYSGSGPAGLVLSGTSGGAVVNTFALTMADPSGGFAEFYKQGPNTWELNPTTGSTYTGTTYVGTGTLRLNYANMAAPTNLINSNSIAYLGSTLELVGKSNVATTQAFGTSSGTTYIDGMAVLRPIKTGSGTMAVTLGSSWTRFSGSLNVDLTQGGTVTSNPTLTNGILGYGTVTDSTATGFLTVTGGNLARYTAASTLAVSSNSSSTNYSQAGATGLTLTGALNPSYNSLQLAPTASGQSLNLNGNTVTLTTKGLLFTGATDYTVFGGQLGAGGQELIVHEYGAGTLTISSAISGAAGSLSKTGPGTLALTGTSSFTGGTTLYGGTVSVTAVANSGTSGPLGAGGAIYLNGGGLQYANTTVDGTTDRIYLGRIGGTIDVTTAGRTLTTTNPNGYFGPLSPLTKTGAGTFVLAGSSNSTNAPVTVSNGTLQLGIANALGSAGAGAAVTLASAGTLKTNGFSTSLGSLAGSGTVLNGSNSGQTQLFVGENHTSTAFTGTIADGGSQGLYLNKTGAGTLTLGGTSANTFTGYASVYGGTLELNKTAGVAAVGGSLFVNGGTAKFLADNQLTAAAALSAQSGGTLDFNNTTQQANYLYQANGGKVVNVPAGGINLVGTSTYLLLLDDVTAAYNVNMTGTSQYGISYGSSGTGATLSGNLNLGGAFRTVSVGDGPAAVDVNLSGAIADGPGTGYLIKQGAGTLQLGGSAANTFTGYVEIDSGTLLLNKTAGTDAIKGGLYMFGGTVKLLAANQIADTAFVYVQSSTFDLNGQNETIAQLLHHPAGSVINVPAAGITLKNNAGQYHLLLAGLTASYAVKMTGTSPYGINYVGSTTGATLSGNIDLGAFRYLAANDGAGAIDLNLTGVISNGSFEKTSTGTLQLGGSSANTYTGATTVSAGTLLLNKPAGVNAVGGDLNVGGGIAKLLAANQIPDTATVSVSGGTWDLNSLNETVATLQHTAGSVANAAGLTLKNDAGDYHLYIGDVSAAYPVKMTGSSSYGIYYLPGSGSGATLSGNVDLGASRHIGVPDGSGAIDLNLTGVVSNGGILKTSDGTLQLGGSSANTFAGTTTVLAGTLLLNKPAGVNAVGGDMSVSGGTVKLGAANQIPDAATVTLGGGTLDLNGFTDTFAVLIHNGGTVANVPAAGITLSAADGNFPLQLGGVTANYNVNIAGAGTRAVYYGPGTSSGATMTGNLDLGGARRDIYIFDGPGAVDAAFNNVIANGSIYLTAGGTVKFGGTQANTYAGLTAVYSGSTLILAKSPNTVAIAGSLTISGGLVRLDAPGQIADGTLSLGGGGTLATGRTSDGVGQSAAFTLLKLDSNSTLALGTGGHTLTFDGTTGPYYGTVYITGWTGTTIGGPGGQGRILFNLPAEPTAAAATADYAAFLSNVQFAGLNLGDAMFIDTGTAGRYEVTPVPEPAMGLLLAAAGLGLAGLARRRRVWA